jgi:hypothetical protein
MFIYKITVLPINQVYIGFDTKHEYKKSRWKTHCRESLRNPKGKLHLAINEYGPENCRYEVIARGFTKISDLALAEIKYISEYNSFKNGLNSTPGGDGLNQDLTSFSDEDLAIIKNALGDKWQKYNKQKWHNTTESERKELIKHCHTPEANKNRAETLKEYYKSIPDAKQKHSAGIRKWQKENPKLAKENRIRNAQKASEVNSKKVTVLLESGEVKVYNSIKEFQLKTGQWMSTLKEKSEKGLFYNGYKILKVS